MEMERGTYGSRELREESDVEVECEIVAFTKATTIRSTREKISVECNGL